MDQSIKLYVWKKQQNARIHLSKIVWIRDNYRFWLSRCTTQDTGYQVLRLHRAISIVPCSVTCNDSDQITCNAHESFYTKNQERDVQQGLPTFPVYKNSEQALGVRQGPGQIVIIIDGKWITVGVRIPDREVKVLPQIVPLRQQLPEILVAHGLITIHGESDDVGIELQNNLNA